MVRFLDLKTPGQRWYVTVLLFSGLRAAEVWIAMWGHCRMVTFFLSRPWVRVTYDSAWPDSWEND